MQIGSKKEIRQSIKALSLTLSPEEKAHQAAVITTYLQQQIQDRNYPTVALFSPMDDEIPIDISLLEPHCRIVLPRVNQASTIPIMDFYPYDHNNCTISTGYLGIKEPTSKEPVSSSMIDIMVVPGIAFTLEGERLGRGKGFYDHYLSRVDFRAQTIGVCFNHQLLPSLPCEQHDRRVNMVLTASIVEENH